MNTLTITQIFQNFTAYQAQYLDIITQAELYFTEVEGAAIHLWPLKSQPLYLGDLLQLWLADKWIEHLGYKPLINTILKAQSQINANQDHYVYAIEANLLTGRNHSLSWSKPLGENQALDLTSALQYYCIFKSLKRPKLPTTSFHSVVARR